MRLLAVLLLFLVPGVAQAGGPRPSARAVALAAARAAEVRSVPALRRLIALSDPVKARSVRPARVTLSRGALLKTGDLQVYRVYLSGEASNAVMVKRSGKGYAPAGFVEVQWRSPYRLVPEVVSKGHLLLLGDARDYQSVRAVENLRVLAQGMRNGGFAALLETTGAGSIFDARAVLTSPRGEVPVELGVVGRD